VKLRNILLIARRDYLAYVARRRFWIGVLAIPIILSMFIFVPALIQKFQSAHSYAVVDQSGWVINAVNKRVAAGDLTVLLNLAAENSAAGNKSSLPAPLASLATAAGKLDSAERKRLADAIAEGGAAPETPAALSIWKKRAGLLDWYQGLTTEKARSIDGSLAISRYHFVAGKMSPSELQSKVVNGKLFAYFVIPAKPLDPDANFIYASKNLTDKGLRKWFNGNLTEVIQARKVSGVGLSAEKAAWLKAPVIFQDKLVTKSGSRQATAAEKTAQWLPVGYVVLLYIAIIGVAQMLMMSTIDEKSNRIAETLLASVDPMDVMAGKTMGIAAVGATMVCAWVFIVLVVIAGFGNMLPIGGYAHTLISSISIWSVVWFVVYFILGFLLYASILGAIGAAVNNIQEAQPFFAPVVMFLYIPMIIMAFVVKDPNAVWARALSYFPPLTPFLMVNRAAAPPPLVDYVATTALLVVTAAIMLFVSGRIFRIGLLNTGAPPKVKELLSWIRTPSPDKAGN
jgi:ABC-type Na+ efflux pump permease subunit